jgi:NAD(P)-dependent dehydrogenase (short-subunit alcohol dehydrogenase family)
MSVENAFRGKCCVITGGASGIGFALAKALLGHDARVLIAGHDEAALEAAYIQLADAGDRIGWQLTDVSDADNVAQLINRAVQRFGRVDYMFNNAGVGGTLPIGDATLKHWRRVIDVNLWGVIHGTQYALPVMRRQGSGHIVNTASAAGLVPLPGQALYNASKFAVVGLSESMRLELAANGIKLTVACSGPVVSDLWAKSITGERTDRRAPAGAIAVEAAAKAILAGVAEGRGILVFPARQLWGWRMYRWFPRLAERVLQAAARRSNASNKQNTMPLLGKLPS